MDHIALGVDIEKNDRFAAYRPKTGKSFLEKIFTERELQYCFSKQEPASHLAARYAGKESVVKALYGLKKKPISYSAIEIVNGDDGAPTVLLHDNRLKGVHISISLSHCSDTAIAFVTASLSGKTAIIKRHITT